MGGFVVVIVTDRVGGWNERTKGLRCHEFGEGKSENKGVNVCERERKKPEWRRVEE